MSQQRPDLSAPEGTSCAAHPERTAYFTCPRCEKHACVSCFHIPIARCVHCMRKDPTEASPPLPFEAGDGTVLGRYFRTFGTAFYPWRSAPAFARPGLPPALLFFALSAVPLILLSGVIPHTRTLQFGNRAVVLLGNPTQAAIALDVARAIGVQVLLSGVELLSLLLPFSSLVAAYAPERKQAAARVVLYRFWLSPLAAIVGHVAAWVSLVSIEALLQNPEQMPPGPMIAGAFVQAALRVLQILALFTAARVACGLSAPMSMLVVGVPIILQLLVVPLASHAADKALPALPEPKTAPAAATSDTSTAAVTEPRLQLLEALARH